VIRAVEQGPTAVLVGADPIDNDIVYLLPVLVWAYLQAGDQFGDINRAEQTVIEAVSRATSAQHYLALVDALWIYGMVLDHQQRWQEAEQRFSEAVALADRMPYPYAKARSLSAWGIMCAHLGQRARARELLDDSLAHLKRLGAKADVARTQQTLATFQ
jgi:tetratricopeptide (TPR) repeat protein